MLPLIKSFEKIIIRVLVVLMAFVLLLSTVELVWVIIKDIITPPIFLLEIDELLEIFGLFMLVLIGNPLIVMIIMGALGYRKRTGFLAGLAVAQISEFSLILGALGLSLGHINAETMGLITLVGLITISASSDMIIFSHPLYEWLAPWLKIFERQRPYREIDLGVLPEDSIADIILFGMGRFGAGIAPVLREKGLRVLSADYNPDLLRSGDSMGYPVRYGFPCMA